MEEVPFDDRHVPRVEIDWTRSAWWWIPLTRSLQPAVRMNALAVGLLAIGLCMLGVELGEGIFAPAWSPSFEWHLEGKPSYWPLPIVWGGGVLQSLLSFERLGFKELAFLTFELLWLTLTLGLLGGLLARRSLVELGQRTISAWGEALRIVFSRWHSYLWLMGMHFVGILAMLIPILLLGWISSWGSLGASVAGVLLLVCFPLVFAIGRFVLSAIVCFPLSVCAIAAEKKADAFEGFSRSNAYFFQRPAVAALCVASLLIVGSVGEQLVFWTVTAGWWLMRGAFLMAGGVAQAASNPFVATGNWLAAAIPAAYWFSFSWSGAAATYLILRKSVDNTELDELEMLESPVERTLPDIPTTPPVSSAASTSPAAPASSDPNAAAPPESAAGSE
jgi:hypothetical protein